ncbi:hypothetical protein CANMA_002876 [Candida margitis]|uniref:uncharacterized protein n=1 Tax=Candida margitis TaxID=1775924 RepID=UPI002226BA6A|nr:uncharacterized protein CANMA_002876 [Candida margitis]KAI5967696.1 hypothetical protein CANMA_002876 [Candida margitis]
MSAVTDDSNKIRTLYKEITLLKTKIHDKQAARTLNRKKGRVSKHKRTKRSFTNPSHVKSSAPRSHTSTEDVENGISIVQPAQEYYESEDGKSLINVRIYRDDLSTLDEVSTFTREQEEQREKFRIINRIKRRLSKYKARNTKCDRVLDTTENITWNGYTYNKSDNGFYQKSGNSRKHDKEKIRVCPFYLNGDCGHSNCLLNHTPNHHNTPLCHFYLQNKCTNSQCRYSHLVPEHYGDPNFDISVCRPFAIGHWCPRGRNCPFLHVWNCPDYEEELDCPRGDACSLAHVFTLKMQNDISTRPKKYVRDQTLVEEEEEEDLSHSKTSISSYTVDSRVLFATDSRGNYQHYIDQAPFIKQEYERAPSTQFLIEISSDEEHFSESEDEGVEVKREKDYAGNFLELIN